jgi:tripartite-type tricarboxylate transporter receptor subunit TctC
MKKIITTHVAKNNRGLSCDESIDIFGWRRRRIPSKEQRVYAGKTIKIHVGFERGVAYDLYARLVAAHFGRHIPGGPRLVVENSPETGSRTAERLYSDLAPDGTELAVLVPSLYLRQLTGEARGKFDVARLAWIGSPTKSHYLLYMRADAPYKTMADIRSAAAPAVCGSGEEASTGLYLPRLLEQTLGAKFKIVTGFKRGPDVDLAVERGELQCRALTIDGFFSHEPYPTWLKTGFIRVLVQTGSRRAARLPDVPTFGELMDEFKTPDDGRRLAKIVLSSSEFGRPLAGPPGMPPEAAQILRGAYRAAMKDPALVAEAKERGLELNPADGGDLVALAREVVSQPRDVIEQMKKLFEKV